MAEELPGEIIRCAALGCSNDSTGDLAFFFLPSEPKLKTLWETNVGRNDLPLSSVVCEAHFSPNDIIDEDEGKTLKYDAVPSMFGSKSDDENDNVRRSARKRTSKKPGSNVVPAERTTRRIFTKVESEAPAKQPLKKKSKKDSVVSNNESTKSVASDRGQLKRAKRQKENDSESESESTNKTSTNPPAGDSGCEEKTKSTVQKKACKKDRPNPVSESESTSAGRPNLISLNGTDERGHAIAEWYLLDVFEATKMISAVLKPGTLITDSLVANVEETIIDVISKLLQRISSVIVTSLEDEFGFHSDIKKILSNLDENVLENVGKMLEFDQEENEVPEISVETREEDYANMLRKMDPNVKNAKEGTIFEEVISPADDDRAQSVFTEHAYFREERLPKGKKAIRENRSAQALQCGFCNFKTKIKSKLRRHMRKHLTYKVYNCPLCDYSTKSEEGLQKHYRTHSGTKPYACNECSFKTANRSNLTRHMLIHKGEKPFQCPYCDHATRQKVSLESHMKSHDPSSKEPSVYVCGECTFVTINRHELYAHVRTHKVYHCGYCEYTTQDQNDLRAHQAEHRGMKHECKICDKVYHSVDEFRTHLETHNTTVEYTCELCAYKTNKYAYYNRHLACHSGLRPFKCEYCCQTFRMNAHLMAHVRRHEIGPYCKKSSM